MNLRRFALARSETLDVYVRMIHPLVRLSHQEPDGFQWEVAPAVLQNPNQGRVLNVDLVWQLRGLRQSLTHTPPGGLGSSSNWSPSFTPLALNVLE